MKVLVVGMAPYMNKSMEITGVPLAPAMLKAYADHKITSRYPERLTIDTALFQTDRHSPADICTEVLAAGAEVVAFSVYVWNLRETLECAEMLKREAPGTLIICGGPHISSTAQEMLTDHPFLDVAAYGTAPGELSFAALMEALVLGKSLNDVEGVCFRDDKGEVIKTPPVMEKMNYDDAPSPYLSGAVRLPPIDNLGVVIETARGCPYDCAYCFFRRGKGLSFFPLERVLAEIDFIYSNSNVRYVVFADSDIFVKPARAREIVSRILSHDNKKIITTFELNLRNLDEETVKLMARLPNNEFQFGIQTVNTSALEMIGRVFLNKEDFIDRIGKLREWVPEANFSVDAMIGLPGDNLAGVKLTLDTCLELKATRIRPAHPIYLLPGTEFLDNMDAYGITPTKTQPLSIAETTTFPREDIEKALRLAHWVDLLTYYYPAIGEIFHSMCDADPSISKIERIERWISAVEKRIDIFEICPDLVEAATECPPAEWNATKKQLLEIGCSAGTAREIYRAIDEVENTDLCYNNAEILNYMIGIEIPMAIRDVTTIEVVTKGLGEEFAYSEVEQALSIYVP